MSRWVVGVVTAAMLALAPAASATTPLKLPAFGSCKSLLAFAQAGAHRTDGGVGVPPRAVPGAIATMQTPTPTPPMSAEGSAPTPTAAAPTTAAKDSSTPFSTTNNQELSVDEPDLVKTDGKRIVAITDRTLHVIDVTGDQPKLVGALKLEGYGHQLLWRNDHVLVIADQGGFAYPVEGGGPRPMIASMPYGGVSKTLVTEISIADPAAPKVLRAMTVEGQFVDARQNGGTARLVISSAPDQIVPQEGETVDEAIDDTKASDYIGGTTLKSNVSGRTFRRQLVHCDQVRHPRRFSGLDVLTIMTVDLDKGLYSLDRDGVMAGAQVVYGSDSSLYVASQRYYPALENGTSVPSTSVTELHRFDVTDPDKTVYRSSGAVPGYVLNQYALSEFNGDLRVATTEEPLWFAGSDSGPAQEQQSGVSVLRENGNKLVTIGRLTGLGKTERIYAVRFIGDRGYLVTFRQVDPLFVVDLSTPSAPKLRGELEIPGFSAYLHPVGDDKLLGIGQEATQEGRITGAQASLFDVSDPAAPKRVSQLKFGQGSFEVANDSHAFLYWDPTKLAVLPLTTYSDTGDTFTGAVGVRVGSQLSEVARLAHPKTEANSYSAPAISRALVIGDRVYTVSYAGLGASTLDTLGPIGYTAFPPPSS